MPFSALLAAPTRYTRLDWASATTLGTARCAQLIGQSPEWFCAVTEEGDEYLGISVAGWHLETYEVYPGGYCRRDYDGEVVATGRTLVDLLPAVVPATAPSLVQDLRDPLDPLQMETLGWNSTGEPLQVPGMLTSRTP